MDYEAEAKDTQKKIADKSFAFKEKAYVGSELTKINKGQQ